MYIYKRQTSDHVLMLLGTRFSKRPCVFKVISWRLGVPRGGVAYFPHALHAFFVLADGLPPPSGHPRTRSVFPDRPVSSDDPDLFVSLPEVCVWGHGPRMGGGAYHGRTVSPARFHESGKSKARFRKRASKRCVSVTAVFVTCLFGATNRGLGLW